MSVKSARLRIAALVAIACASSSARAEILSNTFTLSWDPPTQNDDGTPLEDLLGYYVYGGDSPDALLPLYYVNNPSIVMWGGASGLRYLAVSTVNMFGIE